MEAATLLAMALGVEIGIDHAAPEVRAGTMNVDNVMPAPVVALLAYDTESSTRLPTTFPHDFNAQDIFQGD